jgi:hypothetical protein
MTRVAMTSDSNLELQLGYFEVHDEVLHAMDGTLE